MLLLLHRQLALLLAPGALLLVSWMQAASCLPAAAAAPTAFLRCCRLAVGASKGSGQHDADRQHAETALFTCKLQA